jgi:hypothetical protein
MSDDEGFLARWSRRKRKAAQAASGQPKPERAAGEAAAEAAAADLPPGEAPPPFDPASLPPLESIGAASDIQPFLAAGVPADLTRAALRRAWAADPAIRDFIGLAENSWDFNAPGGVPGFGSVKAEEVRRLLAQAMGEPEAALSEQPAAEGPASDQAVPAVPAARDPGPSDSGLAQEQARLDRDANVEHCDPASRGKTNNNNIAMQHDAGGCQSPASLPRRGHGGALPK